MLNKSLYLLIWLCGIAIMLLPSCSKRDTNPPDFPIDQSAGALTLTPSVQTKKPENTPVTSDVTITPVEVTATVSSIALPTSVISSAIEDEEASLGEACLQVFSNNSINKAFPGMLYLHQGDGIFLGKPTTVKTTEFIKVTEELSYIGANTSPNGFFFVGADQFFRRSILNSTGKLLKTVSIAGDWRFVHWLNDQEWLALLVSPGNTFVIFNPFEEKIVREFSLANMQAFTEEGPPQEFALVAEVDPFAAQAIYFDYQGGGRMVLWDIIKGREIASTPYVLPIDHSTLSEYYRDLPVTLQELSHVQGWNHDGSRYGFSSFVPISQNGLRLDASQELFSIDRNGQIEQLTNLTEIYDFVRIGVYAWSPNNKYLTFWYHGGDQYLPAMQTHDYRLGIYDSLTGAVTDYCISLDAYLDIPIWSPDSQYLLIDSKTGTSQKVQMIVDIFDHSAFNLQMSGYKIAGWLSDTNP